jgi:serine/threonine protein phosphatase PrpC
MTEPTVNATTPASVADANVRFAMRTDVGRVRPENQDYGITTSAAEFRSEKGHLMIVADGMGGHRGGATASRMAATIVKTEFLNAQNEDLETTLRRALQNANGAIFRDSQSKSELRGMGTTCSTLVIRGNQAHIAHVGDSRVYLVRDGAIRQLTDDHSLVATMVREGLLTSREAEVHPRRNVLQRSMGVAPELEVDVLPPISVASGDVFIVCSDGLHGMVKPEEIQQVVDRPVEQAVDELVNRALARGAPDNVTVIVARIE